MKRAPLLLTVAAAVMIIAAGLSIAWPTKAQADMAVGCDPGVDICLYLGQSADVSLITVNSPCTVDFQVDWGDGSPILNETVPANVSEVSAP